uniref:hypothetical protein n=1 Tax=Areca yellow leaf disease phytoplasma TaxID=927614 RepID=UPI0040402DE2
MNTPPKFSLPPKKDTQGNEIEEKEGKMLFLTTPKAKKSFLLLTIFLLMKEELTKKGFKLA